MFKLRNGAAAIVLCGAATLAIVGSVRAQAPDGGTQPSQAQAQRGDRLLEEMKRLTEAPGPPGAEGPVRELMTEYLKPYATKITYDGLGSVIAQQGTTGPRIMVDAHMDELGAEVRHVRPDGYISVQMLGYWLPQALADQRWTILGSKGS